MFLDYLMPWVCRKKLNFIFIIGFQLLLFMQPGITTATPQKLSHAPQATLRETDGSTSENANAISSAKSKIVSPARGGIPNDKMPDFVPIPLSASILNNKALPFISHRGKGLFQTALAMNVQYAPVKKVRKIISKIIQYPLKFHTAWNKNGEAHVTVITPPEYSQILKKYVSIDKIEQIALQNHIQSSDLSIMGIGKGSAKINGKKESTYFIIVHSKNLLKIRKLIYREYLKNGGKAGAWDPTHFFPHITVGYTLRDLHENNGVIKDVPHSLDKRFVLVMTPD